ncbi:EF hand protein (macronuclear) [Tetrahymena thermophila SB210]|uniref:EF hand protein n=1 Tax=Tetrahymena thermophila (strain SB210) TaxID=312017 RepID=Q22CP8_TETTS|nr:EF hand protein [Tetrahymena thermophila SB210]EAR83067.2 EF hand protein [Tetrahymena thermophila SB210]|eukprot:XP_001030730.2 EF hand protein [Tetrahymena thermophila SB210]
MNKTPFSQKENRNFQEKSKQTNPFSSQNAGKGMSDLQIVGRKYEDVKAGNIFQKDTQQDQYVREAKEYEQKNVVKSQTKSGGFKIPEDYFDKPRYKQRAQQSEITPLKKEKEFDSNKNFVGISKQQILQKLGITDEDEGLAYDTLQDRVYENKLNEKLSQVVENKVHEKIEQIHQSRERLSKSKEQLKAMQEKQNKQKQDNWDRLTGKDKLKSKSKNIFEVDDQFEKKNNTVEFEVVGKKVEKSKSYKALQHLSNTHSEEDPYILEAKEYESKHVVKRITKSGGFKIPEEIFEKPQSRKKVPKPEQHPKNDEKEFDDTKNNAGISKMEILQQLGIQDIDQGLTYDRLQDRVYDNKLNEELSEVVENQVFDKIDQIHKLREKLKQTEEQIKKNKEKDERMKQENWDRLTGKERFKPKYINQNGIEEEEFEESNNLEKEVEDYYTKKYNLELSDRKKKEKEDEDERSRSYKDRFFDDKNRFSQLKMSGSIDENVKQFYDALESMQKPSLEETEHTLELISKKNKYFRKIMLRKQGIEVSDDDEEEEEMGVDLEADQHKLSKLGDRSPRKQLYKSPRRFSDVASPLNIQSTVSHQGFKSPKNGELNVQHRENQELHDSHNFDHKLKGAHKFQNPYRRESQTNNEKPKSPIGQQQQHKVAIRSPPKTVEEEIRDYEKWDKEFKNYVVDRKKREQVKKLEKSLEKKDFELYESTSPNRIRWEKKPTTNLAKSYDKSQSPDRMGQSSLNNSKGDINQQNKYQELKMIQTMFDKIDKEQTGLVDKLDCVKYLIKQKQLLSIYDLTSQNLNKSVQQFPTEKKGYFTYEEFVKFLQTPRNILEKSTTSGNYFYDEIKKNRKKNIKNAQQSLNQIEDEVAELNENNSTCLLQAEHLRIMRELFIDLDKHNDMIVSRKQYVEKLRSDVRIVKILHLPALYMPSIDKTMNVDRVLYRIEQEQFIGDPDIKSTKEYLTWQQFLEYFNDIKSLKKGNEADTQEKIKQIKVFSSIKDNVDDQNEVDLEEGIKNILKTEYDKLPKQSEVYVNSFQFIEAVKMNPKYPQYTNNLSRRKADKFDLKEELLCDTLDRMEAECDEYLDFEEIMEYFTRRGRPKYINKKEEDKEFKEKLATIPRQKDNENLFNSRMKEKKEQQMLNDSSFKQSVNNSNYMEQDAVEEIDGYDSDPETHIYKRGYEPDRKALARPKSAFNRSFQKSSAKEGQSSEIKGLSQSITKSYLVDKRKSGYGALESDDQKYKPYTSDEDQYYSSKSSHKKKRVYQSDSEDFNYRDDINEDEDHYQNPDQHHIKLSQTRKNNYLDEPARESNQQYFDSKRNLQEQRGDYKKAMFDYYASEVSKEKKFKLTKPEPYQFDEREKERKQKKTIRQKKVEEMIEEAREKERKEYNTRPKPKEIPDHVKKPLYEKIMHEQEKRRQEVRKNSVAITIQREKPFKFYIRDKNPETSLKRSKRKTQEERDSFVFKANKVPWFCSINLLEKINRDEELKRQERVAKQAQKTMSMSKLPPRMEKHEQERRARELMEGYSGVTKVSTMNPLKREMYVEPSFQPPKAKPIPNFNKMHQDFQERLDKKRRGKRPTEVLPFNFQESRKLPPRDYLDQENELMRLTKTKPAVDKLQEAMKWRDHKPKYQPPSIQKWETLVEKNKKDKEEKEKKKQEEKKKEEERKKKAEEMAVIVREKYSKNDQTLKLQQNRKEAVTRKQQEFKKQEQEWQQKKSEILEKVKNRPLLMEQKCKGRAYLEKLKTLDRIDNRLREKGMSSKERLNLYTKDERKMLDEIKALKARGFKSFRNELDVGDDVSISPPREGEDYEQLAKEFGEDIDVGKTKPKTTDAKKKQKKQDEDSNQDSYLNKKGSVTQKELTLDELSQLQDSFSDQEKNAKEKPVSKFSNKNYLQPSTSNNKFGTSTKNADSSYSAAEDSYLDKKKDESSSIIDSKKNSLMQMKESSFESKKDQPQIKKVTSQFPSKIESKQDTDSKKSLADQKKESLLQMKEKQEVEEEYQNDFDDLDSPS